LLGYGEQIKIIRNEYGRKGKGNKGTRNGTAAGGSCFNVKRRKEGRKWQRNANRIKKRDGKAMKREEDRGMKGIWKNRKEIILLIIFNRSCAVERRY
jgi:hypothetical protein